MIGFVGNRAQTDEEGNLILNEQQQPKYDCIFDDYGYTASDMLEKVQSWTGPFVALYSSLVTSASFDSLKTYTVFQKFIVLLVNAAFALILILPLVGLVVVLLWRIMMLWIVIAISPFLVLKKVFSEMLGNIGGKEADYLNPGEVIKLLLAPVLVGFALSISLMFMSVLKTTFPESPIYQPPKEQDQQNKDAEQIQKEQAAKAKKEQQLSELWGMDVKLNDESGEQEFNML
ncbi:MAG: hypothetical protein Q4B28_02800 [bacterium]|nr:hypothetical protein [bacterium]